ncbi:MAG: hypothetical protein V4754_09530 [Pseudomonadota bacterium]
MSALQGKFGIRVPTKPSVGDYVEALRASFDALHASSGRYPVELPIGAHGLPEGHQWAHLLQQADGSLRPIARLEVKEVVSCDPDQPDPAKAYASKITLSTAGTAIDGKVTPGHHLLMLNTSTEAGFSGDVAPALQDRERGVSEVLAGLSDADRAHLREAPIRNYSIFSERGGDRDQQGRNAHSVTLLVRRQGSCSTHLVTSKPGDVVLAAVPMSHSFVGPDNQTPALFFGLGTSVSPFRAMLKTRTRADRPPASSQLYINHKYQKFEYAAEELRAIADDPNNKVTYHPLFSQEPEKSGGVARLSDLVAQADQARAMFQVILQPDFHLYISGILGLSEQILDGLKATAASISPILGEVISQRLDAAQRAGRIHIEGSAAREVPMPLQGT